MLSATGKKRGFTFLELFMVLLIIGILASVSLPQFRKNFNSLQLSSFSRQLQDLMNYLHQRSIIERKVFLLSFDTDARQYWAQREGESTKVKSYSLPENTQVEISPNSAVYFRPDGDISSVTITITGSDNAKVILSSEGVFGGVKIKE